MKILVLCDRYPYPLSQGQNLRVYNFIRYLPGDCEADLVCYGDDPPPSELGTVFKEIVPLPKPEDDTAAFGISKFTAIFKPHSLVAVDEKVRNRIMEQIDNTRYDIILAYTAMMPYIKPNGTIPVVADVIDDGVLELWREMSVAKSVKQFLINLRYLFGNYIFEKRYFAPQYVSAAFFTSEIDAATFKKICPKTETLVIQNGVDTTYFRPQTSVQEENSIIFEGNMSFTPNVDGAIYFCREILPLIRKQLENVKFYIVGKNPVKEISELASENVVVTGFVQDVRVYLAKASVFVCPLRKGGGIKNKVLQAWSMGKASVVSSFSVGGLNAADGGNVLIRDNKKAFADAVVELLKDENKRVQLGNAARQEVEKNYSWETKSRELYGLMQKAIQKQSD